MYSLNKGLDFLKNNLLNHLYFRKNWNHNMSSISLQLDMDGVFADFLPSYLDLGERINHPVKPPYSDNSKNPDLFRIAVLEHDIFTHLPLMQGALELKDLVERYEDMYGLKINMLTSLNSYEPAVMQAAAKQKQAWLDQHGFKWNMLCVSANAEKANHATTNSILIDDNPECINPFHQAGGKVVLYKGFDSDFVVKFKNQIKSIFQKHLESA